MAVSGGALVDYVGTFFAADATAGGAAAAGGSAAAGTAAGTGAAAAGGAAGGAAAAGTAGSAAVAAGTTVATESGGAGLVAGTGTAAAAGGSGITVGGAAAAATGASALYQLSQGGPHVNVPPTPGTASNDQSIQNAEQQQLQREQAAGGLQSTTGTSGGQAGAILAPATMSNKSLLGG